jgi:hypothetical protein
MFFSSWADLGRVLVVGPLAYVALVLFLRVSGKRTLTKLNAFDLVVTVALGSTLATILLSKSVSLAEGLLALGLLIALQFIITWTAIRSPWFAGLVKSEPTLLVRHGQFLDGALQAQRMTQGGGFGGFARERNRGPRGGRRGRPGDGRLSLHPQPGREGASATDPRERRTA